MTPWWKRLKGLAVRDSGDATAHSGSYANTGVHIGDVYQGPAPTPSPYLYQVRKISPPRLRERELELSAMAEFCTRPVRTEAPEHERWLWWQGPAWSGKSALMSWFVLNPPPGVRVVSFFITARFEGQSDRSAFVAEVLHQLADLAAEPLPTHLSTSNREAYLLKYLDLAAERCQARGERLVLVIDGLDEDRGVTIGPDAHSIASVLPTRLPQETCVAVTGRPSPPIPSDVVPNHPLRNPAVVRPLRPSRSAQVIQHEAVRELKFLLSGAEVEQNMLGLVAAAGGGLSVGDLTELTSLSPRELEERLSVVTGRTFSLRSHSFVHRPEPDVLILAHEELQNTVVERLGERRLAGYRRQLHAWADVWRERGWPADTPGYLLRGYFRLLESTDDIERMATLALDRQRSDRMIGLTGGSLEAIAETAAAQKALAAVEPIDLATLLKLAITGRRHSQRHLHIPEELPAVWGLLGDYSRAVALARSIPSSLEPEEPLIDLAQAFAKSGDWLAAHRASLEAEAMVPTLDSPWERGRALVKIIRIHLSIRRKKDLKKLADAVPQPRERAEALALVASAWSRPARTLRYERLMDHAVGTTNRIPEITFRIEGLAVLAETALQCGDFERSGGLLDKATALTLEIRDISNRCQNLLRLVQIQIAMGELDKAESLIQKMTIPHLVAMAQARLVGALAESGENARAEKLSNEITAPRQRAESRNALALAAATAGDHQRALLLVCEAQKLAEDGTDQEHILDDVIHTLTRISSVEQAVELARRSKKVRPTALAHVLDPLIKVGRPGLAEELVAGVSSAQDQASLLARLARSAAENGNRAQAVEWAERAQEMVFSAAEEEEKETPDFLLQVARAAARSGEPDYALELLSRSEERVPLSPETLYTLTALAEILAGTGSRDRARAIFLRAMEIAAESLPCTFYRPPLLDIAESLWDAGEKELARQALQQSKPPPTPTADPDELISYMEDTIEVHLYMGDNAGATALLATSQRLAGQLVDPHTRVWRQATVVEQLARAGNLERAESLAHSLDGGGNQERAYTTLATEVVKCGDLPRARELARLIRDPDRQIHALAKIALMLAQSGDPGGCHEISNQVESLASAIENSHMRESILGTIATALANAGDIERAESLMATMTITDRRDETALALIESVPAEQRPQMVAQILCGNFWYEAFDAIGSIDSGILVAIRDDLLGGSENDGGSPDDPPSQ